MERASFISHRLFISSAVNKGKRVNETETLEAVIINEWRSREEGQRSREEGQLYLNSPVQNCLEMMGECKNTRNIQEYAFNKMDLGKTVKGPKIW